MTTKRRRRLALDQKAEPYSNPVIERLSQMTGKNSERAAWLEANRPSFMPPGSSYYVAPKNSSKRNLIAPTLEEWQLQRLTVEYLKRQPLWFPRKNTTWRDHAVEAAAASVDEGLRHLKRLASRRNKQALAGIADIAIAATKTLSGVATQAPKRLIPVARHRFVWPFLKALKERFGDDHKRLVKEIQVGHATPFNEEALTRVRTSNVMVRHAIELLCRLESYRNGKMSFAFFFRVVEGSGFSDWERTAMRLERFSAKTCVAWFEVAWAALCADHNGRPETDPELKKLGLYRAEHSTERYSGTQLVATTKTRNANIRDGIKDKLRKAIQRLAEVPK